MKLFLSIIGIGLFCMTASMAETIEENDFESRLAMLEQHVLELQTQLDAKLSECELSLHRWGIFHNNCPLGTVVGRVDPIPGSELMKVTCYFYKLTCNKKTED